MGAVYWRHMDTLTLLKTQLLAKLEELVQHLQAQQQTASVPATPVSSIYTVAKNALHTHITLDPSVPADVGCAEAVSYVLKNAHVPNFPVAGFPGTAALWQWCQSNMLSVATPQAGDVVISPSGTSSKGVAHGHTGIVAMQGILSNDSDTGLFMEKYTVASWQQFFGVQNGFPVFFYRRKA